jgi:hypothetical protein
LREDCFFVTVPNLQLLALSDFLAAFSVLPLSFGTTQSSETLTEISNLAPVAEPNGLVVPGDTSPLAKHTYPCCCW